MSLRNDGYIFRLCRRLALRLPRCPIHIFHGTEDQLIEPEQARRLHEVLRRCDLHLVNDAGHMVTYADGGTIAQAVDVLNVCLEQPSRIIISSRDEDGRK